MAIREVITDAKGNRISRILPGYDDKPKATQYKTGVKPKETEMKSKPKTKTDLKSQLKKSKNAQQRGPRTEKPAFKYAIMALNGDNVYSKKSQEEVKEDSQLKAAFATWLSSNKTGEFIAIRRK